MADYIYLKKKASIKNAMVASILRGYQLAPETDQVSNSPFPSMSALETPFSCFCSPRFS